MKDLSILPEHLRHLAVVDGADLGWPLEAAAEVIEVLTNAGAVILGVEAWMVDEEGVPASVGWSSYDLGEGWEDDWGDAVARSKVEAGDVLAGVMATAAEDGVNYMGIDWTFTRPEEPEELRAPEWLRAPEGLRASEGPRAPEGLRAPAESAEE